jgi:hypothetical protein
MKNMLPVKGYFARAKVFGFIIVAILLFLAGLFLYHLFTDPS